MRVVTAQLGSCCCIRATRFLKSALKLLFNPKVNHNSKDLVGMPGMDIANKAMQRDNEFVPLHGGMRAILRRLAPETCAAYG